MNKDSMERLAEARKYQKMAVKALLPEQTAEHLEVIEGELKAMLKEIVMEAVKQEMKKQYGAAEGSTEADYAEQDASESEGNADLKSKDAGRGNKKPSKVKKVVIG